MNKLLRIASLVASVAALSFAVPVFAQDSEPAPPATDDADGTQAQEAKSASSQEVEVNEDTYRQFMELKDANRQGDIIPETVFKPGMGLQKLEKLPEESQKHLRNELREIIVDGEPWQPGDETADYPYTPSAAAGKDPALRKQEMDAWGELVDSYNQREAQIYANMTGNRAATSTQDGSSGQRGESADSAGKDGEGREGDPGRPPEHDESPDDQDTAGAFSPDAVRKQDAENAAGVSQNALEFLQGLDGGAENAAGREPGAPQGTGGQPDTPTTASHPAQARSGRRSAGDSGVEPGAQGSAAAADAGTTGATQNAMEFLNQAGAQAGNTAASGSGTPSPERGQGPPGETQSSQAAAGDRQNQQDATQNVTQASGQDSDHGEEQAAGVKAGAQGETETQSSQQAETAATTASVPVPEGEVTFSSSESEEESTAGSSQNALEYLKGADSQTGATAEDDANADSPPTGTLNIQDLLNVQGVGGPAGTGIPAPAPDEEKPAEDTKTDKGGGGR